MMIGDGRIGDGDTVVGTGRRGADDRVRIAHVSDYYLPRLGGIELHIHDLAVRQRAAGHQVEVITTAPDESPVATARQTTGGLLVHRVPAATQVPLPLRLGAVSPGRRVVVDGGYDLVHVHSALVSPFAVAAAAASGKAGIPTVVTVHSLWAYLTPLYRALNASTHWSHLPVVWSAVSEAAAGPIRRTVGPDIGVAVLPNAVDPARWQVAPAPRDPDEVVIVSVMRLAPRKRPRQLVRMLRRIRDELPPSIRLRAVIVGEGPDRPQVERSLRRHGMSDWVELPGRLRRNQIRDLFARADVFLAAANLESFGIAALEARAAGLPVVAKAHTGIAEFIAHGREGMLGSTDADLAAATTLLARDHGLRSDIAGHNRAVRPTLTWEHALSCSEAAYSTARSGSQPTASTSLATGVAG
jgi:glycosyltransferase involved in cell wall biosynthesis